jgi:hypothetical protein
VERATDDLVDHVLTRISTHRHQGQGREQDPIRPIPGGAQAITRGARRQPEGGPLPRGREISETTRVLDSLIA